MKVGGNLKRGQPRSERAGEAVLGSGERAALYRVLRELSYSRCGGMIREGELSTREAEPASGLPLVRLCQGCAPFKTGGGLLDALFAPGSGDESPPVVTPLCGCNPRVQRAGHYAAAWRPAASSHSIM
jgi:hypothetical protein